MANGGALDFRPATDQTYSGSVSGIAPLYKTGAGTLTFDGASDLTGNVFVGEGTLRLGRNDTFSSSISAFVGSGATFDLNGYR